MARPPLLHQVAIYYDDKGTRQTIRAEDLGDPITFEHAKNLELYDRSGQVRVYPRDIEDKILHFAVGPSRDAIQIDCEESNPAHDNRVCSLLNVLKKRAQWKVVMQAYVGGGQVSHDLFDLRPQYNWGKEVHRIVGSESIVRHDLFGQAYELDMSIRYPWIAIEVINTHYPEEATFAALIDLSRKLPLVVAFDHVGRPDHFLRIDPLTGIINTRLYMYRGAIWYLDEPVVITSSAGLEMFVKAEIRKLEEKDEWKARKSAEAQAKRQQDHQQRS